MKRKIALIGTLTAILVIAGIFISSIDGDRTEISIQSLGSEDDSVNRLEVPHQIAIEDSFSSKVLAGIDAAERIAEEGDTYEAARILSELYESRDSLSDLGEVELLSLYASLLIELGSNEEAITVLETLLAIEDIPQSIRLDAIQFLSQALMAEEEWELAVTQFDNWLDQSEIRNSDILLNLSYAYFQQELWAEALGPAVEHVELLMELGEEITEERLVYLNSLAFSTGDFDNAAWVTQVLISEFNRIRDWRNLIAIYSGIGNETAVEQVYRDADAAGILEELEASYELR